MSIVQGLLWARTPPPPSFHVINNFKCSLIFSSPTLRCQFRLLLSMLSLLLVCFWFREKIYYKVHPEMQSQAIIGITTWDELRTVNNLKRLVFLTKRIYFSGLPGAPEDCRVSRETNDSLTVLCSPGWSGGLPQTFHLGMNVVTRRKMKCTRVSSIELWDGADQILLRNVTQAKRARFELDRLESGKRLIIKIYSANKKGKYDPRRRIARLGSFLAF